MDYRKQINTTEELAEWYSQKYLEMGDGWVTPASECNRHLDDLGVPFDQGKRLLDVGCGAGHFLMEAQKRVKAEGIEISQAGIEYALLKGVNPGSVTYASIEIMNYIGDYDYIVSLGSLEHVVDLPKALDNIRDLLKEDGKFYFFCPNEKWKHFDQPNERTMKDEEWTELFEAHGLFVESTRRWNDSTAFIGDKSLITHLRAVRELTPHGNKLNVGSGQRPFDTAFGWINMDVNLRWQPDIVGHWNDLSMFEENSMELVVSHHSLEHVGCGEGDGFIREAHRVLKPGGSLLVFVPDMKALAQRWLIGELDDYQYFVNVYGAYMGDEADRHKWGYSRQGLVDLLKVKVGVNWRDVKAFNWREIAGADIAGPDWWIMGFECIK